jgi:hypothetical protein
MQNIVCFFYAPSGMAFLTALSGIASLYADAGRGLFAQMPARSRIVIPLWIEAV